MNQIPCPHCGKIVEITHALRHQIEQEILKSQEEKFKKDLASLKTQIEEQAKKRIQEELDLKLQEKEQEATDSRKRNQLLQEQLLGLTKQLRDLKQKDDERELEMQKKLLEERKTLQEEIAKSEREKANLELGEYKKKLEDTQKALEEARRKSEQTSQQLQGEVLELNIEQQLRQEFTTDEILPVPKGTEGADVWQKVKNKHGQFAGSILWELKRTKAWSNMWLPKLREDTRQIGASIPILVTSVLPEGVSSFGFYERVWVTTFEFAIPLAHVLRVGLLQIAIAKSAAAHKDEKLEELYTYLTADGFKHRFEAQVESIIELRNDLESEQRSTVRLWKKREMQINRMKNNIASLYGELQGIIGQALPSLPTLETGLPMIDQKNLLE